MRKVPRNQFFIAHDHQNYSEGHQQALAAIRDHYAAQGSSYTIRGPMRLYTPDENIREYAISSWAGNVVTPYFNEPRPDCHGEGYELKHIPVY